MKLKKWVEMVLYLVNLMIMLFVVMIVDFDLNGLIILMILMLIFTFNLWLIYKYGGIEW